MHPVLQSKKIPIVYMLLTEGVFHTSYFPWDMSQVQLSTFAPHPRGSHWFVVLFWGWCGWFFPFLFSLQESESFIKENYHWEEHCTHTHEQILWWGQVPAYGFKRQTEKSFLTSGFAPNKGLQQQNSTFPWSRSAGLLFSSGKLEQSLPAEWERCHKSYCIDKQVFS